LVYSVLWNKDVVRDLYKADIDSREAIVSKVKMALARVPEALGKPMNGLFAGLHKYMTRDFTVIYTVDHASGSIKVIKVGKH